MLKKIIPFILLFTVAFTIASTWAKLTHLSWGDDTMLLVIVLNMISVALGIWEVFQSQYIDGTEKIMWAVAFIFLTGIGLIIYLLFVRKKVIGSSIAYNE